METEDLIRLVKRIEAEEETEQEEGDDGLGLHTVNFPGSLYDPGFERLRNLTRPMGVRRDGQIAKGLRRTGL